MRIILLLFLLNLFCIQVSFSNDEPRITPEQFDTIRICNQVWMQKNLNVHHYSNGDSIPQITDPSQWEKTNTGAWCYYNNSDSLGKIYGKLYNWYAVIDPRGLAPLGWRIPDDLDWKELEIGLGIPVSLTDSIHWRGSNQGSKLKEKGNNHWLELNSDATNESGFTALPSGWRLDNGDFYYCGLSGLWWTTSSGCSGLALYRLLSNSQMKIWRGYHNTGCGFSVRCIKNK